MIPDHKYIHDQPFLECPDIFKAGGGVWVSDAVELPLLLHWLGKPLEEKANHGEVNEGLFLCMHIREPGLSLAQAQDQMSEPVLGSDNGKDWVPLI